MAKQNKNPDQSLESKVFNSNQERIDKLKHAFNKLEAVMSSPISAPKPINVDAIIKLNEELTAENSRLLLDVDEKQRSIDYWMDLSKRQTSNNADLSIDLQTIKSKWWYKLMTWGWKRKN